MSHSCLTVQEGEWVGCSTNAIVPGLWIRNTLRRVACDRAPEATWPLWPCFADFDDLIHTVADCRKLGIRQSAHGVGSGLTNTPVKRFGLMAQHVTCLPAFRFFAVPTGMANGLSALYSAVVMGNPMTREVLSLKIRGERTKKGWTLRISRPDCGLQSIQIMVWRSGTQGGPAVSAGFFTASFRLRPIRLPSILLRAGPDRIVPVSPPGKDRDF